ncbi:PAS domain-containing protein [Cyanobacteria bacterium FACHB-DQ100]|nr:PAS domain-containing protein [Cyanobacteria bacterium FACHB-DQ100]
MNSILDTITDGIVAFDREWRFIFVNQRGAEILGQTPQALLGQCVWELYPEAVETNFYREYQRALTEQRSIYFQEFYAPLDVWFEIHAYPSAAGLVVLYQDITVRKQAELKMQETCTNLQSQVEERATALTRLNTKLAAQTTKQQQLEVALKATNERLAQIFESITDGFCAYDREWRYTYVNPKAEELLGKTQSELIGRSMGDVFPEAIDSEFYRQCQEVARTRSAISFEDYSPFLDCWFQNTLYPYAEGVAVFFQDVTARKCIEQERNQLLIEAQAARIRAEQAEQRYAFLCEASAVLSSSLDYHTTLAHVAQLTVPFLSDFCLIHKLEEDGRLQPVVSLHHQPEKQSLVDQLGRYCQSSVARSSCLLVRVLQTGLPQLVVQWSDVVARSLVQDQQLRELYRQLAVQSIIVLPLKARDRIFGTFLLAVSDSERRYSQTDLMLTADLANRAAISIDNAQLHQRAMEADRLKDQFLMALSHELRTPSNAILGWANILRRQRLNERTAQQALEAVERNAKAQVQIIYDLLTTARIVTGKLQLNPVWVDLTSIIETAIVSLRLAIEAKSIELAVHLEPSVGPLRGDPNYLQQVAWSLLSNAIKFTPDGGQISIRLGRVGNRAQLQIQDTGEGIKSSFLPHVFERFRQADGSTQRPHQGLGLGLALARHLVELHGGTVHVESQGEGRGATFTVLLPLPSDVSTSVSPSRTLIPAEELAQTQQVLKGLQLLVVEPEPDVREMLTVILEGYGATVTAVESAQKAIEALNQFQPNVLVSDAAISNANLLMQQVKVLETDRGKEIPAIALTSSDREGMPSGLVFTGFARHVPKPIDPVELAAVVSSVATSDESQ